MGSFNSMLAADWQAIQPRLDELTQREKRMLTLRGDEREVEECRLKLEADAIEQTIHVLGAILRRTKGGGFALEKRGSSVERRG